MATTTANQQIRVPQSTDDPNVVEDLTNAVTDLEKRVVMVFNNTADRSTRVPAPTEGMVAYMKDTDEVQKYDGSTWTDVLGDIPAFSSGTTVPSNVTGNNGDVFFKIDA